MSLVNANEAKKKSISNIPTKNLDELLSELSNTIKVSTDNGIFRASFIIPKNTPENIQEVLLKNLNDNKYSVDTKNIEEGLSLHIDWSRPLP